MTPLTATCQEILRLDKEASGGPWLKMGRLHYDMFNSIFGSDGHLIVNFGDGGNGIDKQTANADLILEYRNHAPAIAARLMVVESQIATLMVILLTLRSESSLWKIARAGGCDQYSGMPPAMRYIDEALAKIQEMERNGSI